jgi:hypothetical protein
MYRACPEAHSPTIIDATQSERGSQGLMRCRDEMFLVAVFQAQWRAHYEQQKIMEQRTAERKQYQQQQQQEVASRQTGAAAASQSWQMHANASSSSSSAATAGRGMGGTGRGDGGPQGGGWTHANGNGAPASRAAQPPQREETAHGAKGQR